MNMHIVIIKTTFSEFADSTYFGAFNKFIELPLDNSQMEKLINFYVSIDSYKSYISDILTKADGTRFKFVTSNTEPNVGYAFHGLVDVRHLNAVVRKSTEYLEYIKNRDELWQILGWNRYEERIAVIETEFNSEDLTFSNIPSTFTEIKDLYNSSSSIENFLSNLGN